MDLLGEARIKATYEQHYLRAESIEDRLKSRRAPFRITELDLAIDPDREITDQNHTGGVDVVVQAALAVPHILGSQVLDVGSGLGGVARLLAYLYVCKVVAIELTATRHRDAIRLTRLVGLEHLVDARQGDFMTIDLPRGAFDIVFGFDTFAHFADKPRLLRRCVELLRPEGYLIVQDSYLKRTGKTPEEVHKLEQLADHTNVSFATREEWLSPLGGQAALRREDDITPLFAGQLGQMISIAKAAPDGTYPDREVRAWDLASELVGSGMLGYMRFVAVRL